jgi:glycosyltransferase involved in cell wall biosynthesis
MFEYMSTGKPIISSDLPVLREVLVHEQNALLVPPDDVDAWEAAVRRLQSHPALAARLGERAREDLMQDYTWRSRVEKVLRDLTP